MNFYSIFLLNKDECFCAMKVSVIIRCTADLKCVTKKKRQRKE